MIRCAIKTPDGPVAVPFGNYRAPDGRLFPHSVFFEATSDADRESIGLYRIYSQPVPEGQVWVRGSARLVEDADGAVLEVWDYEPPPPREPGRLNAAQFQAMIDFLGLRETLEAKIPAMRASGNIQQILAANLAMSGTEFSFSAVFILVSLIAPELGLTEAGLVDAWEPFVGLELDPDAL